MSPHRPALALVAASALIATTAPTPAAVPQQLPPESRQFDFWLGEWDVNLRIRQDDLSWQDSVQAQAHVFPILDGKAVLELWSSGPIKGYSLRYFDVERGEWVLWLNWPGENRSGSSSLGGTFRHGRGEFFSTSQRNGTETISRYTFSDITPDSLRWDDAFSGDGGATWSHGWIMEFTRRAEAATLPPAGGPAHTWVDGSRCTLPPFRTLDGLAGRREGIVGDVPSVMTGYQVLDGCAVLLLTATPGAGPAMQAFQHLTWNTYASRFEMTHLDGRPESSADVFYSRQDATEVVLYPSGQNPPDRRVHFDVAADGAVAVIWQVPEGDDWREVFRSSFAAPE